MAILRLFMSYCLWTIVGSCMSRCVNPPRMFKGSKSRQILLDQHSNTGYGSFHGSVPHFYISDHRSSRLSTCVLVSVTEIMWAVAEGVVCLNSKDCSGGVFVKINFFRSRISERVFRSLSRGTECNIAITWSSRLHESVVADWQGTVRPTLSSRKIKRKRKQ